ncbi:MAG: hypothetical protein INR73_21475 [Williamsia sp.]|nr:hypothetical protein [Williamsia sp.]
MRKYLFFLFLAGACLGSCDKTADDYEPVLPEAYTNLHTGKYILYRLDSTKFINFGQSDTVVRYQAKDVIDAPITDNQGRPGWRVIRYLRDSASTSEADWNPSSTYMVVASRETLEVIENNMRFQKLKFPLRENFSWKGNSYIDTYSIDSDVRFLFDWDYTYKRVDSPFTTTGTTPVPQTVTIEQRNETLGSVNNKDSYSERNYAIETYGKGIGLVYKDFLHWVFQPRNSTFPNGYKEGYGIRLRMVGHN